MQTELSFFNDDYLNQWPRFTSVVLLIYRLCDLFDVFSSSYFGFYNNALVDTV